MDIRQHTVWTLTSIVLVAAGAVLGVTRKPVPPTEMDSNKNFTPVSGINISVPSLIQVKSLQINLNFPHDNPPAIYPDTSQNKDEISKLLNWLKASNPVGYENAHAMPMLGPTELDIYRQNGKELEIQPAIDPRVISRDSQRTTTAMTLSNEYIVLRTSDRSAPIRLYSPELARWLGNGWGKDIPWTAQ